MKEEKEEAEYYLEVCHKCKEEMEEEVELFLVKKEQVQDVICLALVVPVGEAREVLRNEDLTVEIDVEFLPENGQDSLLLRLVAQGEKEDVENPLNRFSPPAAV